MTFLPDSPLTFYDHHRQRYGDQPLDRGHVAEFMIGDYGPLDADEGVGPGGEFKISLHLLSGRIVPQINAFHDAVGSLRSAISCGLLEQLEPLAPDSDGKYRDEFALRLIGIGIMDCSDNPILVPYVSEMQIRWFGPPPPAESLQTVATEAAEAHNDAVVAAERVIQRHGRLASTGHGIRPASGDSD